MTDPAPKSPVSRPRPPKSGKVALLKDTPQRRSSEVARILRTRLRTISILFVVGLLIFLVRNIVTEETEAIGIEIAAILANAVALAVLSRKRDFSHRAMRIAESLIFGTMVLFVTTKYFIIFSSLAKPGIEALEYTWATNMTIHRLGSAFFALIVIYGLLIPGSWKKAALSVGPLVVIAMVIPVAAGAFIIPADGSTEELQYSVPEEMSLIGAHVGLGALIAIYGAHVMNTLRLEAFAARRIGHYQLESRIGQGGMGEVWKVSHRFLARPAAMKVIKHDSSSGSEDATTAAKRFEKEAQATARLQSPHTVSLYDFGIAMDGTFYYVMEFLHGLDLDSLIQNYGPQSSERCIHFMSQVCESLAEAHHHDMIHRDVKPANIFICRVGLREDFVKVLDFGLVKTKLDMDHSRLTKVGTLGTPAYLAPEQARGKDEIDGRADIYALGCVAYWMLTGKFVFEADSAVQMAIDHMKKAPAPPSQRTSIPIPAELESVILDCLAKEPVDRPQDALELQARLLAVPLETPWTKDRAREWWRLHRD